MKTTCLAILLLAAASCAMAQTSVATNAPATGGSVLRPSGGQSDALATSLQTMEQADAAYNTALAAAAPGLADLDAKIAHAREALMNLQMQRQRMERAAERSIADVANARDAARDAYTQASHAVTTARQASIAAQRASAASAGTAISAAVQP